MEATRLVFSDEDTGAKRDSDACCLCSEDGPGVYYGLSIIGIAYPGSARFICGDCIERIKKWS